MLLKFIIDLDLKFNLYFNHVSPCNIPVLLVFFAAYDKLKKMLISTVRIDLQFEAESEIS